MIKHVVMWRLKEESKKENMIKMKEMLENLNGVIDGMTELEVGFDFSEKPVAYDIVLYSVFESKEAMDGYQVHPQHVKAKEFIMKISKEAAVVDYEV